MIFSKKAINSLLESYAIHFYRNINLYIDEARLRLSKHYW